MRTVLITGATGFVGRAMCAKMLENYWRVKAFVREESKFSVLPAGVESIYIGSIEGCAFRDQDFAGVDTVVHLAARAHIMKDAAIDPLELFRKVNVVGTERLARVAAKCGIRRLIFISSIGVNGEFTQETSFCEKSPTNPYNAYTVSKEEAEKVLHKVSKETGMEVVILRPPMVYGPNAPGNFARLMRLIKAGIPLPFGGVKNLRSFIYIGNLVDAVISCITNPQAAGETFTICDGQDISTPELIKMIAFAMGRKARLFSLSPGILRMLSKIAGKGEEMEKITGNLRVDAGKMRDLLGWKPPFTLEEGLKETVKHHKA